MKNIVLMDGAVGTTLWHLADAAGIKREPVWKYNIEHPELVLQLHKSYIEAGAEVLLTNTFGANVQMVSHASDYSVEDVVKAAVKIAKQAVEGTDRKLIGSCGPLKEFMEPYGDLEEEEVEEMFTQQIGAAVDGGVDAILLQTFLDLDSLLVGCRVAKSMNVPFYAALTFEKSGRTMMGNTVEQACRELEKAGASAVGMNCSLGPDMAVPIIREFTKYTELPLLFKPNAGLPITAPDGTVTAPYTAKMFVDEIKPALDFVTFVGGCCNTDFEYVKLLKNEVDALRKEG
ncbi:MAG: homocysteine S-methyltransferase family protein [Clostridiales bacterium]|nr:homocysteine S-methyltransferase family protein [Clostridiales bacterium]